MGKDLSMVNFDHFIDRSGYRMDLLLSSLLYL